MISSLLVVLVQPLCDYNLLLPRYRLLLLAFSQDIPALLIHQIFLNFSLHRVIVVVVTTKHTAYILSDLVGCLLGLSSLMAQLALQVRALGTIAESVLL